MASRKLSGRGKSAGIPVHNISAKSAFISNAVKFNPHTACFTHRSVLKLSDDEGSGRSINCSLVEALVVGRAFCGGSGPDVQVCVNQIQVLQKLAHGSPALEDTDVSVATSPGLKGKRQGSTDLKAADKILLAALLKVLPTYCALLNPVDSASWSKFVTTWIENGSSSTSWPGTILNSEAVYLKLLGCLTVLLGNVKSSNDSSFYTDVISSLVEAMESGTMRCGGELVPPTVFRAVLEVIGIGCISGGEPIGSFYAMVGGVIKRGERKRIAKRRAKRRV